ncbi:flagellin N-terminal helical domain-containing protein [Butyrivibrio sp. XBB1001]|uniref:flagellin N-terminal helical domain-containing protein n=1 Tax=Butyrivibrio sp. XBB1001 TaxID=1280682 RepID=UPI00041F8AE4|nr:flagellin [Butyrivibrio sp. XBB1001]
MVVQHNISGMNANRQLNITTGIQAKSSEKLSSGYRINRAADDAAGLAISEKMRRQVRGLTQASSNAQDGVSWCQIADGALNEVSDMLVRASDLSIKAANDTLQDTDREYINAEVQRLSEEIDRIHGVTEFNNIHIFSDEGFSPSNAMVASGKENSISMVLPNGTNVEITCEFVDSDGNQVNTQASQAVGQDTSYADSDYAKFVQSAAADAIANLYNNFPTLFSNAASNDVQVGLKLSGIDGSGGTLARASLSMSYTSSYTVMSYTMQIDTADYPLSSFDSMTDAQKADLAATIGHEMTHLAMYDTLTDGMLSGFPQWFVEGVAQTSSGDGGWLGNRLNPGSSEANMKSYMSQLDSMPYGAGYLAAMYLGYAVSAADGNTAVNSSNIASGLNKLMGEMSGSPKKTLDQAIADLTAKAGLTGYSGLSDFESHFKSATAKSGVAGLDPLAFTDAFLDARGTNGAGSLFGNLSTPEETLFAPDTLTSSGSNYAINTGNTQYANAYGTGYVFPEKQSGIATGTGTDDGLGNTLFLQVGSETSSENEIALKRFNVTMAALSEGKTFNTTTRQKALETIDTVKTAAQNVSRVRSYYGAMQNRLEHTIKNLDNVVENTQAAESRIRDTDMAAEMVKYSNNNILAQAGQAMLAQANQTNQGVLSLLQ